MPITKNEDVKFTLNGILGNLKTSMNLDLKDICHGTQENLASTDYHVSCSTLFVHQEYELDLCVRVDKDNRMDANVTVLMPEQEGRARMLMEMNVSHANLATIKEVSVAAISAALTRNARIHEAQEAGM